MATQTTPLPKDAGLQIEEAQSKPSTSTFVRVIKYMGVRLITLAITVAIGLYLTIIIANMGGYVDKIRTAQLREDISQAIGRDPQYKALTTEERQAIIQDRLDSAIKRYGMDTPFVIRSFVYLKNALTLDLGRAQQLTSNSGSNQVRLILLERLPPTLVLMGTADLLLFFSALFMALALSRKYGSIWDKILIGLTPLSAAPGWFFGLFLILIFASWLRILPFGGMMDAPVPDTVPAYILSLLKHMILPVSALTLSGIFISIYNWRTFFLIYSSEDYVDMAKAKGLSDRTIERRYVLRPTLPTIITGFALLMIGAWTGATILETIFSWPGLGTTLYRAISAVDTPVIIGETVIYAYLLAVTVLALDFVYALVDPRVKIGGEGSKA